MLSIKQKLAAVFTTAMIYVGSAAAADNITVQMQPLTDLITWVTNSSALWIGLVILGVMLGVAMAIGYFIKAILNKATASK